MEKLAHGQKKNSPYDGGSSTNGPCRRGKRVLGGDACRSNTRFTQYGSWAGVCIYQRFFHRAITRKRNNVSNKDCIPATLIYLNTGGEGASSNSFILPAYTACTRPTNANTGGAWGRGDFVAVSHTTSRNNMGQGKEKQFDEAVCVCVFTKDLIHFQQKKTKNTGGLFSIQQ